jgi:predicted DNA-binding protein (MmcQ/YjbR family)
MNTQSFNDYCQSLRHSTHVVQWSGSHVWKVGGKMYAICATPKEGGLGFTFKCSPMSFQLLKEQKGCRPAPYLASRGMLWIQCVGHEVLDDEGLRIYIAASYQLIFTNLPKKLQLELA